MIFRKQTDAQKAFGFQRRQEVLTEPLETYEEDGILVKRYATQPAGGVWAIGCYVRSRR